MCNSGYVLTYVDGLGTSYARYSKYNARFYGEMSKIVARLRCFTEICKKKLPCIFQATNEVMFLSWSLIKRQKPFFL